MIASTAMTSLQRKMKRQQSFKIPTYIDHLHLLLPINARTHLRTTMKYCSVKSLHNHHGTQEVHLQFAITWEKLLARTTNGKGYPQWRGKEM